MKRQLQLALLNSLPHEAQIIYWVWRFICEAEGSGIEGFLLQSEGIYAPQIHAALAELGAQTFVTRIEAGIPLAAKSGAEFRRSPNQSWFARFSQLPEMSTLRDVDSGLYPARYRELRAVAREFIQSHIDTFVRAQ